MLMVDSRPAQTQAGRVASAAFDRVLAAMNRTETDRTNRQTDLHTDEATITLSVRRHGLALEQFVEVAAAINDYHSCDEPIHTCMDGWQTHRLMRTGREFGLLGEDELLDPAIINLLAHSDALLYAGLAIAAERTRHTHAGSSTVRHQGDVCHHHRERAHSTRGRARVTMGSRRRAGDCRETC